MNMVINLTILLIDCKLTIYIDSIKPWFCLTFHSFQGLSIITMIKEKRSAFSKSMMANQR